MFAFGRYIGIDYSGAQTPTASLKWLRVYMADRTSPPVEVTPPPSLRKHLSNLTPADVYFGRGQTSLLETERIKRNTIQKRRLQHQKKAA
jgi:hypothetical protein